MNPKKDSEGSSHSHGLISALAHELRTPLVGIKGMAATGRTLADSLSPDERLECFSSIESEADRLNAVISQAVTLLEMETGDLRYLLETEPLLPILENATIAHDRIRLVTDVAEGASRQPLVVCDRTRTIEVLAALISNAERFSPANAPIEVQARWGNSGVAAVEIIDHGPGIDEADFPRAFQRFASIRPHGYEDVFGAGLGLFLAQSHIAAQGGRLRMEPAPATGGSEARGTMLSFTLPLEVELSA